MGDTLKGKVAVVTGSGQGIGRGIAIAMGKEGASVVTNNRKRGSTNFAILKDSEMKALSPEKREWALKLQQEYAGDAETTAGQIKDLGGEAMPFFADISRFEEARRLVQAAVDNYGKIDILVNVAGTFGFSPVQEMTEELWDHVTMVKPKGYFNTIRHAAPFMIKQKWGRILNCTSKAWAGDMLQHCEYAAANAGVVGLTRAVAQELFPYGITCNAFSPWARTRASFELEAYRAATAGPGGPAGRSMLEATPLPDELGPILVYLASEDAGKVSGSVFNVGGNSVGIYEEPVIKKTLTKGEGTWTVEELKYQVPRTLLADYHPYVQH